MSEQLKNRILTHLKSDQYQPTGPREIARDLDVNDGADFHAFRDALRDLMHAGRVVQGARGAVVLPTQAAGPNRDEFVGSYRHNRRGFGFVVPSDPTAKEDLFIPPRQNAGAINGDTVRARITERGHRDGKAMHSGRVIEVLQRRHTKFAGTLEKRGAEWVVMPDGNSLTEPILTPDAAGRHVRPGTKVVVEITAFPDGEHERARGVITEVLGAAGEKDVDLKSVLVNYNLPEHFPDEVVEAARAAVGTFDPDTERSVRLDLTGEMVCTIDPPDAKDYDDAISLKQVKGGLWELGVHIADVSHFVKPGSPLDVEAKARGNSTYFPGHVVPMLPEILSNGVCSLQEGVPRLCKSAFITLDEDAKPVKSWFANTIIQSRQRLRYIEAQAIIDRADAVPHPEGDRKVTDYPADVVTLLDQMNDLSKRIQVRRKEAGQLNLDLPTVNLVLDPDGKVVDAVPEDTSFTHTLIEMFMVEANEAVARLLDAMKLPFLRRTHPTPEGRDNDRLRHFVQVAGYKIPKEMDRKDIQKLLETVRGKPEAFAINLAILKSLTRAEYSPQQIGHYALASEQYGHFTSPIRRYADLTIHRLLDAYFAATGNATGAKRRKGGRRGSVELDVPSYDELVELGRHISFTERRSEDAERELRQVKILTVLQDHVGQEFGGVITGITNFGIFVQISTYLVDGLIRYEDLMDDWWDVDERAGVVRGQRTGKKIGIGDVCKCVIARVDLPRRELNLSITQITSRGGTPDEPPKPGKGPPPKAAKKTQARGGGRPQQSGGGRGGAPHGQHAKRRRR